MDNTIRETTLDDYEPVYSLWQAVEAISLDEEDDYRSALAREGIRKCDIFVLNSKVECRRFWEHLGCTLRDGDFSLMQVPTETEDKGIVASRLPCYQFCREW